MQWRNLKEPAKHRAADAVLPGFTYRTCPVLLRQQGSDESCLASQDTHHLCLMTKKSKKKASKKDQVKEIAQVDDQDESVEVEDNYNLDRLNSKDKFIIMKIVEKNDELEEENEKQEQ